MGCGQDYKFEPVLSSRLSDALPGIAPSGPLREERVMLLNHAAQSSMAPETVPPSVKGAGRCEDPGRDVELVYGILGSSTGLEIKRPTTASAFLRRLGLKGMVSWFCKLSKERCWVAQFGHMGR